MQLKKWVTIRSGLVVARKATREGNQYDYQQLTLKSFHPQCRLDRSQLADFKSGSPLEDRYLTQVGDVIVRLTMPYTAVLIDEQTAGLVVTSNFAILRQEDPIIYPKYLYWLMNSRAVKAALERDTASTMMGSIGPKSVGEISVVLPPMEQQKTMGDLYGLSLQEQWLLEQLIEEKSKYNRWVMETAQRQMREEYKL